MFRRSCDLTVLNHRIQQNSITYVFLSSTLSVEGGINVALASYCVLLQLRLGAISSTPVTTATLFSDTIIC